MKDFVRPVIIVIEVSLLCINHNDKLIEHLKGEQCDHKMNLKLV